MRGMCDMLTSPKSYCGFQPFMQYEMLFKQSFEMWYILSISFYHFNGLDNYICDHSKRKKNYFLHVDDAAGDYLMNCLLIVQETEFEIARKI